MTILKKRSIAFFLAIVYIAASFLSVFCFFCANDIYTLFGNHSVFYPYLGIILAGEPGLAPLGGLLAFAMAAWWLFSVGFIIAAWYQVIARSKYNTLRFVVLADAVFTILFAGLLICCKGFAPRHGMMLLGGLLNLCFGGWLSRYCRAAGASPTGAGGYEGA